MHPIILPSTGMSARVSLSSEEVHVLIHRYLLDAGLRHSAFVFHAESGLARSPMAQAELPPGALVTYLQKGLLYMYVETHVSPTGLQLDCDDHFSLLRPHEHAFEDEEAKQVEDYDSMIANAMMTESSSPQPSPRAPIETELDSTIVDLAGLVLSSTSSQVPFAACTASGRVYLQRQTGLKPLESAEKLPGSLTFSPDGLYLLGYGNGWVLWDRQGNILATGEAEISHCKWSKNSSMWVGITRSNHMQIHSSDGSLLVHSSVVFDEVVGVDWFGEHGIVAASREALVIDEMVREEGAMSSYTLKRIGEFKTSSNTESVSSSPDKGSVAISGSGGVSILSQGATVLHQISSTPTTLISWLDETTVVSAVEGLVIVHEIRTGKEISRFQNAGSVLSIACIGKSFIACACSGGVVAVWGLSSSERPETVIPAGADVRRMIAGVGGDREIVVATATANRFRITQLESVGESLLS